ncbi:MAG: hypothetical protein IKY41_06190 [Clostridia bacterium]|nr:hypothetical protein [Clostridia bacterium]
MKTTNFEQLKSMLKSMSYSIFNRIGSLETTIKPPHKPQNMAYVTDENGNAGWAELPKQVTGGDKNWVVKSTAYDAMFNGEEIPDIAEYYSELKPENIVDMLKNATIGNMMLCFYDKDSAQNRMVNVDDIRISQFNANSYFIIARAETADKSFSITFNAEYNEYDVVTIITA